MPVQEAANVGRNAPTRPRPTIARATREETPEQREKRSSVQRATEGGPGSEQQVGPIDKRFRRLVAAGALRPDVLASQNTEVRPAELLEAVRRQPETALEAATGNLTSDAMRLVKGVSGPETKD